MILLQDAARTIPESRYTRTVLLVHDRPVLRRELSTELRFTGYRVFEAASPADAVRIAERQASKQDINLLAIDAGLNGNVAEVAQRVLALHPDIPTLLLGNEAAVEPAAHSPVAMLPRPFSKRSFMAAVHTLVYGTR